jgi:starch phosphorylase
MADPYFVLRDLNEYIGARRRAIADYTNPDKWWKMAITNTAMSGIFSTDRTIREYNQRIWRLSPLQLPAGD